MISWEEVKGEALNKMELGVVLFGDLSEAKREILSQSETEVGFLDLGTHFA